MRTGTVHRAAIGRACQVLESGGAIVVPNPPPMAYGLIATSARAINAIKGRPMDQATALSTHSRSEWAHLMPSIDVPPSALAALASLLDRRLSLLVALRKDVSYPDWMAPAVLDGWLGVFNGRWGPTAVLWDRFPRLFGSSANLTGEPPAASAAQARAMFGTDIPVIEVPMAGSPQRQRLASTMVRLDRAGRLALHRKGIHVAGRSPDVFLQHLAVTSGLPVDSEPCDD